MFPNIVLNVSNDGNFDSVEWQKQNSDDSWSAVSGATNTQFTPSEVGVYRVKGIINCDSETVEYFSASNASKNALVIPADASNPA